MLQLKYLYDRRDLVMKILSRWSYDEDSLDLLDQYRISSNAVYPFLFQGQLRLLRFFPVAEKPENAGESEISFLKYLEEAKYPSLRIIPSLHAMDYELFEEEGTVFFACVFAKVPGVRMDSLTPDRDNVSAAGKALGELHRLSALYAPGIKRWSYVEALDYCRDIFREKGGIPDAMAEADFLEKLLNALPKTREQFGLIHFDFERDNLFFCEETKTCHVIDFDDAMVHFFAADVERAILDLSDGNENLREQIEIWFLKGYRSVREISEGEIAMFPLFQRFFDLFGYARILRVLEEPAEATPAWMTDLIRHLQKLLDERSANFGKPLFGIAMRGSSGARDAEAEEAQNEDTFQLCNENFVVFGVPDLIRTASFYEDKLRFTAIHDMNAKEPSIYLHRDKITIQLVGTKSNRVFTNRELYGISLDAYIVTGEPDLLQAEFIQAGVCMIRPIGTRDNSREFVFADNDGRWIGAGLRPV